ncbi:hypothetical protein 2209_scaffold64_00065 [Bacteriophage sp.]|nr:hypothetical protein 2209_scaffold64_00065 [Bacteriophage sp.]
MRSRTSIWRCCCPRPRGCRCRPPPSFRRSCCWLPPVWRSAPPLRRFPPRLRQHPPPSLVRSVPCSVRSPRPSWRFPLRSWRSSPCLLPSPPPSVHPLPRSARFPPCWQRLPPPSCCSPLQSRWPWRSSQQSVLRSWRSLPCWPLSLPPPWRFARLSRSVLPLWRWCRWWRRSPWRCSPPSVLLPPRPWLSWRLLPPLRLSPLRCLRRSWLRLRLRRWSVLRSPPHSAPPPPPSWRSVPPPASGSPHRPAARSGSAAPATVCRFRTSTAAAARFRHSG